MNRSLTRFALKVAAGYAAIAGLWILLSDRVLEMLVPDKETLTEWSTFKGWFFVAVTAELLYIVLRRELRRVEEEAKRRTDAEEALRESEARFRLVVETINDTFWIRDPVKDVLTYISPGFERTWGRSCADIYASEDVWHEAIVPEDRERVRIAASTRQATGEYEEEFRIKRPNGELRWIHAVAFPVKDANGNVSCIVGVAQDVTARKKLEQQFLRAQRLESIGTLAGGVAHDLNNILAPILMGSSLLKQGKIEPSDMKLIGMIEAAAQRGAGIIRQLLTFSRGVEGKRSLVQVRHLLTETAGIIRETFPRNVTMSVSAPADLWLVNADATLLHQIFMNLCVNARDAMPDGGRLSMSAENAMLGASDVASQADAAPGPYAVITVTDTGVGIPPENLEHIFDPFFTTKGPGKGTGLGLSTVLGIVKGHGGFITVQSEPGKGSAFKVHLPASHERSAAVAPANAAPSVPGNGEQVIVVDDEAPILEASRRVLEEANFRVFTARNGQEALNQFLEHRDGVQVVVTDIMMPVMDGPALIRSLRSLDRHVAIIATSGLDDPDKGTELAELGVKTVLAKPCSAEELRDAVVAALREAERNPRFAAEWEV